MKRSLGIAFASTLLPALAFAQPDSQAPPPTPPPVVVEVAAAPPAPIVVAAPAPQVVVQASPAPMIVEDSDDAPDAWNVPMFTTGALVFGASYGTSVIIAAANSDNHSDQRLYVPVVGPWLALSDRGSCNSALQACDHETTVKVGLVIDGLFQAAGILGMLDGVLMPTHHHRDRRMTEREFHVAPMTLSRGEPGVAMFGSF